MSERQRNKRTNNLGKLSRRETLKWMGVMSSTVAIPMTFSTAAQPTEAVGNFAPWPQLTLKPVTAPGYGQDPNLIVSGPAPWPKILTEPQLKLLTVLSDTIVPAENEVPSASEVGVPDVVDEWISAPYPRQRQHRSLIEPGLVWMDHESHRRNGKLFVLVTESQQLAIVDDIAFSKAPTPPGLEMPKAFFAGLRSLVVGAFFTSPSGIKDMGYIGNTPIQGDYPGPTAEAMVHIETLMGDLGLK